MAISEEAQRNHDALFPNHKSTLKVTDPELIEIFDNWAFGEVLQDGTLDTRTRLMVQLVAIIAYQAGLSAAPYTLRFNASRSRSSSIKRYVSGNR